MPVNIAVIILTYNEEASLSQALNSVCGWAQDVYVIDSHSRDGTAEVASKFRCAFIQHPFEDYAKQRNWALDNLPISTEWTFFLDADEWLPDSLKDEIERIISSNPREDGFFLKRRLYWMGRWIRRGYYPTWIIRLFRTGKGRCEARGINEHIVVEGATGRLQQDFIHEDRKPVGEWIAKHNRYSEREALELLRDNNHGYMQARLFGTPAERSRWLRYRLYNRMPPLVRPVLYFIFRYLIRGGILDGLEGFIYHFLHCLWYQMLIDVKYLEFRQSQRVSVVSVSLDEVAPAVQEQLVSCVELPDSQTEHRSQG